MLRDCKTLLWHCMNNQMMSVMSNDERNPGAKDFGLVLDLIFKRSI